MLMPEVSALFAERNLIKYGESHDNRKKASIFLLFPCVSILLIVIACAMFLNEFAFVASLKPYDITKTSAVVGNIEPLMPQAAAPAT